MKTLQIALLPKIYGPQIIPERQRTFPTEGFPRDDLPPSPRSCVRGVGHAFPPEASGRLGPREVPACSQRSMNVRLVLCLPGGHAERPRVMVPFSCPSRPHKRDPSWSPSHTRRAGGTCPSLPLRKHSPSALKGTMSFQNLHSGATCRRKPRLEVSGNPTRATRGGAGAWPLLATRTQRPSSTHPSGSSGSTRCPRWG